MFFLGGTVAVLVVAVAVVVCLSFWCPSQAAQLPASVLFLVVKADAFSGS